MTELQMPRKVLQLNMETQLKMLAERKYGKGLSDCTDEQLYYSILELTKEMTEVTEEITGDKKLYYISAEFLIGKLLSNNLINLGMYDQVKKELEEAGKHLAQIEEAEPEPSGTVPPPQADRASSRARKSAVIRHRFISVPLSQVMLGKAPSFGGLTEGAI